MLWNNGVASHSTQAHPYLFFLTKQMRCQKMMILRLLWVGVRLISKWMWKGEFIFTSFAESFAWTFCRDGEEIVSKINGLKLFFCWFSFSSALPLPVDLRTLRRIRFSYDLKVSNALDEKLFLSKCCDVSDNPCDGECERWIRKLIGDKDNVFLGYEALVCTQIFSGARSFLLDIFGLLSRSQKLFLSFLSPLFFHRHTHKWR